MKGWSVTETARGFGCSASHITRVEHGHNKPSRALVNFYEEQFEADGLLLSLFEVVDHAREQRRRTFGGRHARIVRAIPGDASTFVDETIPSGTMMAPGELFVKSWRIQNSGTVPWRNRRLERQGPLAGPGLIVSPACVDIPDADPGETVEISVGLRAPGYDATSICYFKMVDAEGFLCFPDNYTLGLDVLVLVRGNSESLPFRQ
jgi:hypothetical protein